MKPVKFIVVLCLSFMLLSPAMNLLAQVPEVHLWEHPDYGGGLLRLNVEDCMKDCSYANNEWKDDISSLKVPDGYVLYLYDGNAHQFVGNCPELYCVGWGDHHWDNKNNAFGVKKLPAGWDAPADLPTGIYRFYNPYEGQYLHTGGKDAEDGQIVKNANNWYQPNEGDNGFNFLLIRSEDGGSYTIVSIETGRNWRPEGSGKEYFSIKEGTPLRTNHFNDTDTWSNFTFQPVGTVDIGGVRRLFSIKTKGSDDYFVTLPCRDRGNAPTFEKGGKNTAQQWQIQLVEELPSLNKDIMRLITEKESDTPEQQRYTMLEFLDEETTVPHKKMSMKIPFYAVNDNRYGFKKRMQDYPIYILEREEFVVRKGSNKGWTENRRDQPIEFTVGTWDETTSGSSHSFNLGTSFSYTQETAATGIFFNTKTTWSIGLTMGFDKSWHSSHTQKLTTSTKEYVSPCTKAALFGLATKITVRRADKNGDPIDEAPVAQWTYYDKNSIVYDAKPLHPDDCTTLSPAQYEEKLAVWKREYEKPETATSPEPSPAPETTQASPPVSPASPPTSTGLPPTNAQPAQPAQPTVNTNKINVGNCIKISMTGMVGVYERGAPNPELGNCDCWTRLDEQYSIGTDSKTGWYVFYGPRCQTMGGAIGAVNGCEPNELECIDYLVSNASENRMAGTYRIQGKAAHGRFWHVDGGDKLASTRYQSDDDFSRFVFEPQTDGSYRIKVKAMNLYLHSDGNGDKLVSVRYQSDDGFSRFVLETQDDGTYRIKVKATNRYLHENGGGDKLISTRYQVDDAFSRFILLKE